MKITLNNIKSIDQLDFEIPSSPGVYIISATNGVGKTSLLNAISYLFDKTALKKRFQPGKNGFDDFKGSQISFTDNKSNSITYKFTKQNWHPTKQKTSYSPPSNFKNGAFIRIDQHRVAPKEDNLKGTIQTACSFAKDVADVLANPEFLGLATVTIAGRRKGYVCGKRTERYFSSGELAVIQILQKISAAKNGSLILVDEAEISLHPSTQRALLEVIEQSATTKQMVVLISTHSQTLIKAASNKSLYFLEKNGRNVSVINPCYPSFALQAISPSDDYFSDRVFLFEDEEAILFFNELKARKQSVVSKSISHICIPIAGWPQTANFLKNARLHFKKASAQEFFAIFDKDVQLNDLKKLSCYGDIKNHFSHLPLTPEITPIEWLCTDSAAISKLNRALMQRIAITALPSLSISLLNKKSDEIKKIWTRFISEYALLTSLSEEKIKGMVYGLWIDQHVTDTEAKQFFGKIF